MRIFSSTNTGLDKIKQETERNKTNKEKSPSPPLITATSNPKPAPSLPKEKNISSKEKVIVNRVGAPKKNLDQSFAMKNSIKVSALLNSITRVLTEKYMSELSRDELLRNAINQLILKELSTEDKLDLLSDVKRDLILFRKKHPTTDKIDKDGNIIKSAEEIEEETLKYLRKAWNIS